MAIQNRKVQIFDAHLSRMVSRPDPGEDDLKLDKIAPFVTVMADQSEGKITADNDLADADDADLEMDRAPRQEYPRVSSEDPITAPYSTRKVQVATDEDLEDIARDQLRDEKEHMAKKVRRLVMKRLLRRVANKLTTAGNFPGRTVAWTGISGGSTVKLGNAGAKGLSDLMRLRWLCEDGANGFTPDTMVIDFNVFRLLQVDPEILAAFAITKDRGVVEEDLLVTFLLGKLSISNLVVVEARNRDGSSIWGDNVLFMYRGDGKARRTLSGAKVTPRTCCIVFEEIPQISAGANIWIRSWQENDPPLLVAAGGVYADVVLIDATKAFLGTDAI